MSYADAALLCRAFDAWLTANRYDYLADGVGNMPPGEALLEIARRAGVRGLTGVDLVADTLPMVQDIIKLRCKPRKVSDNKNRIRDENSGG